MKGAVLMKRKGKLILGALVALAIISFIFIQIRQDVHVPTQRIEPREFSQRFTEEGVVQASQKQGVYPRHSAPIAALLVKEGEEVEAGQLVAILDDQDMSYQLAEAAARLEAARIELQQARENQFGLEKHYNRLATLYEEDLIAEVELEDAEAALGKARTQVDILLTQEKTLRTQLHHLQKQQEDYRLYAPMGGIVSEVKAQEGEAAPTQTPLLTIFAKDGLQMETRLLTSHVYDLAPGMTVNITFKRGNEDLVFPGEVIAIAPYAQAFLSPLGLEEERVLVTITPHIPPGLALGPGYRVEVEFVTGFIPRALVVAKTALFTYGEGEALFVVEDNRAQIRLVTTGPESRYEAVITEGLEAGDVIILDPRQKGLDQGVKVSPAIADTGRGEK